MGKPGGVHGAEEGLPGMSIVDLLCRGERSASVVSTELGLGLISRSGVHGPKYIWSGAVVTRKKSAQEKDKTKESFVQGLIRLQAFCWRSNVKGGAIPAHVRVTLFVRGGKGCWGEGPWGPAAGNKIYLVN